MCTMGVLQHRIDFVVFLSVRDANPNGDPLAENMPRMDRYGRGEMTGECIKRKLRNRLQDMGYEIYLKSNDRADDDFASIQDRVETKVGKARQNIKAYNAAVAQEFIDARMFGCVYAWGGKKGKKGKKSDQDDENESSASLSFTGPVTVNDAQSLDPVFIREMQITKSANGEAGTKRGSDTMGMRRTVEFGVYRINGSINIMRAQQTGMTEEDAEILKEALRTMFVNDESAARPAGSMEVLKIYWFEHDCAVGNCNARQVFESVETKWRDEDVRPSFPDGYVFSAVPPAGVTMTEIEGI